MGLAIPPRPFILDGCLRARHRQLRVHLFPMTSGTTLIGCILLVRPILGLYWAPPLVSQQMYPRFMA